MFTFQKSSKKTINKPEKRKIFFKYDLIVF